ncbi:MAG: HNH endonuclease [Gaiellaceae bacterium]
MALATRCLGCGTRTRGSRCPTCSSWQAKRKIQSGWKWGELRAVVHARDGVCVHCGSADRLQVHHRVPLSRDGTNALSNLELLCSRCHALVS